MRTKKFIKHNLPVDNYQIVDTYSLGEDDYLTCDNCGKVIKNIESCISECARLYNRIEFEKGLKPLI